MIDRGRYSSMFAPRQSGKTTFLEEVCSQLHKSPIYVAIFLCFQDFKNLDKSEFYSSIERELYKPSWKSYSIMWNIIPTTGQFLLTAWLYQFVRGGAGELRYEVLSGLGRMDVLLTYKGRKYIIETKINRRKLTRTLKDGITQLSAKYLASESAHEGYLIVFDTKTPVGEDCEPQYHEVGNKRITSFNIAVGKDG